MFLQLFNHNVHNVSYVPIKTTPLEKSRTFSVCSDNFGFTSSAWPILTKCFFSCLILSKWLTLPNNIFYFILFLFYLLLFTLFSLPVLSLVFPLILPVFHPNFNIAHCSLPEAWKHFEMLLDFWEENFCLFVLFLLCISPWPAAHHQPTVAVSDQKSITKSYEQKLKILWRILFKQHTSSSH